MNAWCVLCKNLEQLQHFTKLRSVIDFSSFCCEGFVVKSSDSAGVLNGAVLHAQAVLLLLLSG